MADDGNGGDKPYKVGRGKPPAHTRWKKGVSGNPSGRSKKPPSLQEDLIAEGARLVPMADGSGSITVQKALAKSLYQRAIHKDNKAANLVVSIQNAGRPSEEVADGGGVLTEEEERIFNDFLARQNRRRGK